MLRYLVFRCARACRGRKIVVTDMDETLISKKSTGYVRALPARNSSRHTVCSLHVLRRTHAPPQIIKFLVMYKSFFRLIFSLPLAAFLIPLSKVSRSAAVRTLPPARCRPCRPSHRSPQRPWLAAPRVPALLMAHRLISTVLVQVRVMYWLAFRGLRVDKAKRIADEQLSEVGLSALAPGGLCVSRLSSPPAAATECTARTRSPTALAIR